MTWTIRIEEREGSVRYAALAEGIFRPLSFTSTG
jgi:hypothetical protein